MFNLHKLKLKTLFYGLIGVCSSVTLLIYIVIDYATHDEPVFMKILQTGISEEKIKNLMQGKKQSVVDPLKLLYLRDENALQFYYLPKLQYYSTAQFTEITTANRDSSYPLAPDFTFHIDYSEKSVVLYEAFQPGCVFRLYLFPVMPRETRELHRMTANSLRDTYIKLDIDDGPTLQYSLAQLLEGKEYPFLYPISATHKYPASGLGSYSPFCYQKYMKITYVPNVELPRQLLHTTINCSKHDLRCPIHIYAGISRTTFPKGTDVKSFKNIENSYTTNWIYKKFFTDLATAIRNPENNGPDKFDGCHLKCQTLCAGCSIDLYNEEGSGVINAIKMRVFKLGYVHPTLLEDWNNILITAIFDRKESPQIDRLPLGTLFGVTGSLNDFSGASMGHKEKQCTSNLDTDIDTDHNFPEKAITGYFYFPMPYWENARIYIEGLKYINDKILVCYEINRIDSYYDKMSTGYFHAHKTFYTDDTSGWRNMLTLNNFQGHIVGVLMDVDNLRAVRNVPLNERFATLQADPVLFVDDRKEAAMIGTGLEDYFSYAHGFALAENTTYAFVGNYHASPLRKEPLTWHAYRLHLLDPIPFHKSVQFVMEGTNINSFHEPVRPIPYFQYQKRLASEKTGLSHTVFYYGRENKNFLLIDHIDIGNVTSEINHTFTMEYPSAETSRGQFTVNNKMYLGQVTSNTKYNFTGRNFRAGDKYSFYMKNTQSYSHMILRRHYYSPPLSWKQRAKIWINEQFLGFWYIGMGTVNADFSLREDDFMFSKQFVTSGCALDTCDSEKIDSQIKTDQESIHFEIEVETNWMDIGYHLFAFNKN